MGGAAAQGIEVAAPELVTDGDHSGAQAGIHAFPGPRPADFHDPPRLQIPCAQFHPSDFSESEKNAFAWTLPG